MNRNIKKFISSLKTPIMVAKHDGVSVQAIYKRIKKGEYKTVEICGSVYIISK